MNEEELKAMMGEAAFNAMSAEQKTAMLGKVGKPKEEPKPEPKPKDKGKKADDEGDDEGDEDESDLRAKVAKEKQAKESKDGEIKGIEKALKFNLGVSEFVKANVDALPAEIGDILKAAEKETYDSAKEKAGAVQAAIVQSFFAIQANVDLLTAGQKSTLDDYLKLTKNGKEQKAQIVYENLFEPALETLKKVKKAEELSKARSGFASSSKVEDGYKARLMAGSRALYLNEKGKN